MNLRFSTVLFGSAFAGMALLTLIDAAAKGFALFAVAALVALVLRRASAATRHIVWVSALACALALPCCAWILPQWRVLPAWMSWEEVPKRLAVVAPMAAVPVPLVQTARMPTPLPARPLAEAPLPQFDMPLSFAEPAITGLRLNAHTVLLAWLSGAALLLAPLFYSTLALWRISARSRVVSDGPLAATMEELQREIGLRRRIRLLLGDADTMPMVWGILRPRLLLPSAATSWAPSRLRGVLLHELAHLRRHDPLSILIAQLALAIHWFNPLAWLAVRQLRAEQERACDDYVLSHGVRASDYASDLLEVATGLRGMPCASAALTMAHPARLEGRIMGILDAARNRRAVTRWIAVGAAVVATAVALPLAMLRAAEGQKSQELPPKINVDVGKPLNLPLVTSVTVTPDTAEIVVTEGEGSLAFVVGEGAQERVVVHKFGRSPHSIIFRVDADDRRGRWWDQARIIREGASVALFPELPNDWLSGGRVIFLPKPATRPDGGTLIAEIESASGKVPLAVRSIKPGESSQADERRIPRTCPETEIIVDMRIHALSKNAPEKALILPVMAAQDLVGLPREALMRPYLTVPAGAAGKFDRGMDRAERVEVTPTLVQGGVQVKGSISLTLLGTAFPSAAEAWHRNEDAPSTEPRTRTLRATFDSTLGGNDALVVPIASEGLFPETIVVSLTATPRRLSRTRWLPEEARLPIQVDGWVLTWPRSEHEWFSSLFDYKGLPEMISGALERRKTPREKVISSESVGTLEQPEVEQLLQAFRKASRVVVERVEPFEVKQHHSSFLSPQDQTKFSAGGERASLLIRVRERHISPYLTWETPVLEHLSASSGIGLYSGTSLCTLLPGPADPENIRMLVLRCVDPDAEGANAKIAEAVSSPRLAQETTPTGEAPSQANKKGVRGRILDLNGFVLAESADATSRRYPFQALAGHTVGYVGKNQEAGQMEGRNGVEEVFDEPLRKGEDVRLSLDARLQSATEKALSEPDIGRGTVVILDSSTGEVRALASTPNVDINAFVPAISVERWQELRDDDTEPLMNRALQAYAPGATYLPVVALAASRAGKADLAFTCSGAVMYGNKAMNCWISVREPGRQGHGKLNLREALQKSCNCYFYQLGNAIGIQELEKTARDLGLGERSGLGLAGENPGLVPSPAWLRTVNPNERWSQGYTANVAVGQGSLLTSPLQMATVAAAIANGGRVLAPTLVAGGVPQVRHDLTVSGCKAEDIEMLRASMIDVVQEGTGRAAKSGLISIAGRTGTSQYWREEGGKRVPELAAWFIGFAPAEAPRYAFAILVQGGKSGGATAAPLARRIMEAAAGSLPAPEPQAEIGGYFDLIPSNDN